MVFIDNGCAYRESDIITLCDLKKEFIELRKEDPENYGYFADFKEYLMVIIMDTINGRNDCDIIGMTPEEISRFVEKLLKAYGYIK